MKLSVDVFFQIDEDPPPTVLLALRADSSHGAVNGGKVHVKNPWAS